MQEQTEQSIEYLLRKQALLRVSDYIHPQIKFTHEPINLKQCDELQSQLRQRLKEKIQVVKREYQILESSIKYDQVYTQFAKMTIINEGHRDQYCKDIKQMHQIADILMNPPSFSSNLMLNFKEAPTKAQQQEFNQIYQQYQKAYKLGQALQNNQAEQIIKKAKKFVLQGKSW